ncbi:MAG: hypothetical protein JWM16_4179 [Verrucomicrobiales bacterium]|nr:hypothetical protein [Verrucomicrobiales bacterium]
MKTLALLTVLAALTSGCATSRHQNQGTPSSTSEIYHGGDFGLPGSNSGTSPGTMGSLQNGISSQDNAQAAVPSARSYQPASFFY